jgi:endogenous inhibitor of DNA gyrase (YacG/DUF329 family)
VITVLCDSCGAPVEAQIAVPCAIGRTAELDDWLSERHTERMRAKQFELCPECAAALVLAFKTRRATQVKGGLSV